MVAFGEAQPTARNEHPSRSFLIGANTDYQSDTSDLIAALPLKATSDGLIARFFENDDPAIPINYILHRQTFMEEYARHCTHPSRTPIVWLGLLFSMLCIATRFYETEDRIGSIAKTEYSIMSERFYRRANSCMDMVDSINLRSGTVEFMAVFLHAAFLRRQDNNSQIWLLAGDTVRFAMRMGYHRDPAKYRQFTPFEVEMRRRVWHFISQTDLLFSFQLGLPPVVRSHEYDTFPPQNFEEEQLFVSMEELPVPKSHDVPTHFSYMMFNHSIFKAFRLIVEHLNDLRLSSYGKVLDLHQKLLDARWTLPSHFRPTAGDDNIDDPFFTKRTQLDLFYNKSMCVLHRKFMIQVRPLR